MIRFPRPTAFLVAVLAISACATKSPAGNPRPSSPEPVQTTVAPATSQPPPVATPAPPPEQAPAPKAFDPSTVTQEVKKATFSDAKILIQKLNAIIQAKDFEAWKTYLTQAYIVYYSDPIVLARLSESPILKSNGIVLRNLQDYFLQVVYRSRQNARLDDIDFVSEDSIVAITLGPQGERLVLYNLERQRDSWKIGIGR